MDAAIYTRLSKNRRGLSKSCQLQKAEALVYAEEKVWSVVFEDSDDDISASKFSNKPRPGYDRLIEAVKQNRVEAIICTEMTRLYRRVEELLPLIKLAEHTRLKAIWTTDDEGYDLSTPEGIHRAIGAVNNAALESAKTSKRVKRTKAARAKEGVPNGGRRSYGFESDNETPRPEEIAHLKEAGDRWISGEDLSAVIRDFNEQGILTTTGRQWRIQNLRRTLLSKRYLGIREHLGAEYEATWPAVFTQEQHQLMLGVARTNKWKVLTARKYLLTGFTYCICGTLMVGSAREYKSETRRRYRCRSSNDLGEKAGCGRNIHLADPLEEWVTEAILFRFDSPEVAAALAPQENQLAMEELLGEFQEGKAHLDGLVVDYGRRLLDKSQFALAKQAAEAELEQTKARISKIQDDRAVGLLPANQAVRAVWNEASFEWKQAVIRLVVERINVTRGPERRGKRDAAKFDPELYEIVWRA